MLHVAPRPGSFLPRLLAAVLATAAMAPCPVGAASTNDDPFESFNRTMFDFNRAVVTKVVNPTVDTLGPRTPDSVKTSLKNAYNNLTEIEFVLNGALRGDLKGMAVPAGRFVVNSTIGVAGLFDVATPMGMPRQETDFIESLCHTGLPPGPYVVLPLVGSANTYSAAALAGGIALEVYALSFISTTLAAADFIIIDLGGSAAGLRYMNSAAEAGGDDPYQTLRQQHQAYVVKGCADTMADAAPAPPKTTATPPKISVAPAVFRRTAATRPLARVIAERVTP